MNRRAVFSLTFALTLAVAATAWAGGFSGADYQGRIESDHGTFFGFDLKQKDGTTKVAGIEALVKLQCSNGESGPLHLFATRSLRVDKNKEFKGTVAAHGPLMRRVITNSPMTIDGKLQKHGKAKGTVDARYFFVQTNRGGQRVHCYSGAVDWKAQRGALVNPDPQG